MMRHLVLAVLAAVGLALLVSGTAHARQPLHEVRQLYEPLLAAAVGEAIVRTCPDIQPRMLTVMAKGKALERQALALGYTEDELRAFRTSKAERKRLEARRDAWLAARGIVRGDRDAHCRLGTDEIAARSLLGSLLRAR
jgi:hypothetical protein